MSETHERRGFTFTAPLGARAVASAGLAHGVAGQSRAGETAGAVRGLDRVWDGGAGGDSFAGGDGGRRGGGAGEGAARGGFAYRVAAGDCAGTAGESDCAGHAREP